MSFCGGIAALCSHAFSLFRKPNPSLPREGERMSDHLRLMKDASAPQLSSGGRYYLPPRGTAS